MKHGYRYRVCILTYVFSIVYSHHYVRDITIQKMLDVIVHVYELDEQQDMHENYDHTWNKDIRQH